VVRDDPAFKSAIERAYLAALKRRRDEGNLDGSNEKLHAELMEEALYAADRTAAGLRFARLEGSGELEERLMRALTNAR
jgi:hypothetical protein